MKIRAKENALNGGPNQRLAFNTNPVMKFLGEKVSEYDQNIPPLYTVDHPKALTGISQSHPKYANIEKVTIKK